MTPAKLDMTDASSPGQRARPGAANMAQRVQLALGGQKKLHRLGVLRMVAIVLALGLLVPWLANAYWIKTLTSSMALAVAVTGVALLYGQLGLVSLCQYALVGVGGWVALRLSHGLHLPFELCVVAAGISSCAVGMVAGLPVSSTTMVLGLAAATASISLFCAAARLSVGRSESSASH